MCHSLYVSSRRTPYVFTEAWPSARLGTGLMAWTVHVSVLRSWRGFCTRGCREHRERVIFVRRTASGNSRAGVCPFGFSVTEGGWRASLRTVPCRPVFARRLILHENGPIETVPRPLSTNFLYYTSCGSFDRYTCVFRACSLHTDTGWVASLTVRDLSILLCSTRCFCCSQMFSFGHTRAKRRLAGRPCRAGALPTRFGCYILTSPTRVSLAFHVNLAFLSP